MPVQVRSETITRRLTAPSLYILSKKKKQNKTKEMIISLLIYFARSTYKGEWFYACVWRHTEYLHVVIRANESTTFFAKKSVPSCSVIIGFNVMPSKKKKKRLKKKKIDPHAIFHIWVALRNVLPRQLSFLWKGHVGKQCSRLQIPCINLD